MSISIEPAKREDLPGVLALLRASGLPPDGLEDHAETTLVAMENRRVVGCAALELYGEAALLRSVAVAQDLRGAGLGQRLTEGALDLARERNVREVYLLTETANGFFPRFGFRPIPRSEAPPSLQRSVEFTSSCPAGARTMRLEGQRVPGAAPSPAIIGSVQKDDLKTTDLAMMRRALQAAESAAERGEVPVGAVVARGETILAVAANEREFAKDPTAHAELLAIRRAAETSGGWRLTGCTLYSTLEPCPMCAGAAHAARLSRLVYAAPDPKAGYAGTLHNTPADSRLNHTIAVESGILGTEAAKLLQTFFKGRRKAPGKPYR